MIRHISALVALAALSLSSVACMAPTDEDASDAEESTQDVSSVSAHFETYRAFDGQYRFYLVAGNGESVLSSEWYTRSASAENGMASVVENGIDARNFVVGQANNGDWYFKVVARNGQTVGLSELYVSKSNAERGAATVRSLVRAIRAEEKRAAAQVEQFEIFRGLDGKSYFHLRAANGELMLSSQGYTAKASAEKGIASVLANGTTASRFEVSEIADGTYTVRLKAANGEIIARGESYASKSNATRAVARLTEILAAQPQVGEPAAN